MGAFKSKMDIFVGSLPFKLKEEELKALFEAFGEVTSCKIIIDKITRQNKGFGFVEMPDDAQARQAIAKINGSEVMGRTIIANTAQPKADQPKGTPKPFLGGKTKW
jgi:RNA recognition motif-containing protein